MANKSGLDEARWLGTIIDAIEAGDIPLKNPKDLEDNLPYAVPDEITKYYHQIHFSDVNNWLDDHPDYGPHRLDAVSDIQSDDEDKNENEAQLGDDLDETEAESKTQPAFDPLPLSGISKMFILGTKETSHDEWLKFTEQGSRNDLNDARVSKRKGRAKSTFDPELVGDWL